MISLFSSFLLAVSMAMDCLAVSIVSGAILRRWRGGVIFSMALLFGLFQALMPLLGWLVMRLFASHVLAYGPVIAALLLFFVGGRMVWGAFQADDSPTFRPDHWPTQLLLAVATSIDALAVGAGMAVTGSSTLTSLVQPLVVIGLVSLLFSLMGHGVGILFGRVTSRYFKPELLGGIILILLGVKVLTGHVL